MTAVVTRPAVDPGTYRILRDPFGSELTVDSPAFSGGDADRTVVTHGRPPSPQDRTGLDHLLEDVE